MTDAADAEFAKPARVDDINFMRQELMECPYHAYQMLREEAPVWRDPTTGFYVISRYDDIRAILMDPKTYSSARRKEDEQIDSARVREAQRLYETRGWVPDRTLALRDDPEHAQMRSLLEHAFRAGRVKEIDPYVRELAYRLMRATVDGGECDFVRSFAVPFPLIVIGNQMGVPEDDIWKIKTWTEAFCHRTGLMQKNDSDFLRNVEQEIEAQHYFQPLFERLRKEPDGSLLSDLVNGVVPGWDRPLNDCELHAEMMADTFVGGSETSTNALSAGVMLLGRNPQVWRELKADPDKHLRTFIEEVLRLESPVQSRLRRTTRDVEVAGVVIPQGSFVDIRFAAANRDEKRFECPGEMRLDRRNAATHIAFGSGVHHCLGAPLARRELHWGFRAFIDLVDDFSLVEGRNDFAHTPNFWLRSLKSLHISVQPSATAVAAAESSE